MVRSLLSVTMRFTCVSALFLSGPGAHAGNVIRQLTLDDSAPVVELFDGMESGQFQVKLAAKSANLANVFIKNATDSPLTVALPKAAVGVHILPQFQGQNPNGNNPQNQFGNNFAKNLGQAVGNNQQGGGRSQSVGGQFQPMGNQQGFPNQAGNNNNQGFFGNGMFSIPPEKTVQLKMRTVCLDYGSPDPHLGLKYELQKLETVVSNPVLRQLLEEYSPRVDPEAMQAAAWHLSHGLNWKQVSHLPNPRVSLSVATMFTANTVKAAQALVKQAETAAEERGREPPRQPVTPPAKLVTTSARVK